MNSSPLHLFGQQLLSSANIDTTKKDKLFTNRFFEHLDTIENLFNEIYGGHPYRDQAFDALLNALIAQYKLRPKTFLNKDEAKAKKDNWFLSLSLIHI